MRKHLLILLTAMLLVLTGQAQLTGTKNIPGDYATLAAAITDLNTVGVGSGGVVLNVAAAQTATGTALQINATGTASAPITIQGNGNTISYTGTAGALDGVFVLNGSDYVTINNFAITVTDASTEWGVALLTPVANDGCQNVTVQNMNITLNKTNLSSVGVYSVHHTAASTTALVPTAPSGSNSFNKFYNNSIQNVYNGYVLTGHTTAAAPYDLLDQQNEIGNTGGTSSVSNFGGGANTANGVVTLAQNKLKVFKTNVNGGAGTTGTLYGIYTNTALNANIDVYNDTVSLSSASTGSSMYPIYNAAGGNGGGNTINMYNNRVENCVYTVASSGLFYGITQLATATYTNMYGNVVTNNTVTTSGIVAPIYYSGSSGTLVFAVDIYNNTVTNNFRTAGLTGGIFYAIYASATTILTKAHDNIINNNGNAITSAGATYGYYNNGSGLGEQIYNNQFTNLTGGTGETVAIWATTGSGPTTKPIYNNEINGIIGQGQTGAITANFATEAKIYRNNIHNIRSNATTGTAGTPNVYGINIGTSTNLNIGIYNNFISDLKAPAVSNTSAIYGIWLQGASGTGILEAYNNTVYLNASSSGTNFGSAALFAGTNPFDIKLRNNILVNVSTPAGTGVSSAIARASTTVTNYNIVSSYNCLYAGTPGANRLIYTDGTNNDQTIAAFINRVNPREHASFSELPPFVNVATAPYDLHINPAAPTQCESGGTPNALVAVDFDGNARFNNAGFPAGSFATKASDVGADEFGGNAMNDVAAPRIDYTKLVSDIVAGSRTVNSFATISDPSNVNTTAGTKPRLYYKKTTNANTFNDNTAATDGWKYVEASNSSSPYSFTIDYTLLQGGAVAGGDLIQYFVIAQDQAATPNVSMNAGGFTSNPTSVNLAAANFPITGTINQYLVSATTFAGVVNVGSAETITSLTNIGGFFQQLKSAVVTGDIKVTVTSDLLSENGQFALSQWAESGAGGYKVTIVPDGTTLRSIQGLSTTAALIRLDSADRVTIDGRFSGGGRYLRFRNNNSSNPAIALINDAQNNTIRNTIIESNNTIGATVNTGGAINIGNSNVIDGSGNDNNLIAYNEIRDRSDVTGTPASGIYAGGSTSSLAIYNDNNSIIGNIIHDFFSATATHQGILVGTGNSRFTIDSNSFYQTSPRVITTSGITTRGIVIAQSSSIDNYGGYNIRNNYIGGTSANGGTNGAYWTVSSSGSITNNFNGINVTTGTLPTEISGNVIKNIDYTTVAPTAGATQFVGIVTVQGIYNVNNNQIGAPTGTDSIRITVNTSTGTIATSFLAGIQAGNGAVSSTVVSNNKVGSISVAGSTTGSIIPQFIQVQGTPVQPIIVSNNLIGSTSTANSINMNSSGGGAIISFGIRVLPTTVTPIRIVSNTVQNYTDANGAAGSIDFGIYATNTVGLAVSPSVTDNIVREMKSNAAPTAAALTAYGISVQGFDGTAMNINNNTVSGLRGTNNGTSANAYTVGIYVASNSSGGNISKNKLWDFTNVGAGSNSGIFGIYTGQGLDWTVSNNMVSITNGANSNNQSINAIADGIINGNYKAFYNSAYVGGTNTGAQNSYAFIRFNNSNISLRNNLLVIDRSGTPGINYAAANTNATPAAGWSSTASAYNTFVATDAANAFQWGTSSLAFSAWKTTSGGDLESYAATASTVPSADLFNNTATGDLSIKTSNVASWYANGKAIAGTASNNISSDFGGDIRGTTVGIPTDIGADEFTPDAGVMPPLAVASAAPATGTTTTYSFAGRKLGEITWGAAGTVPSNIDWQYYSGLQGAGAPAPAAYSYHDVPATGGSGFSYSMKLYYTEAEKNQIPDANITNIKKDGVAPWGELAGVQGSDAAGKFVTSTGLTNFSLFSLAPIGSLPVKWIAVNAQLNSSKQAVVSWKVQEQNVISYDIQSSKNGTDFATIGRLNSLGNGVNSYGFTDLSIIDTKTYYRIKQTDRDGIISYSVIVVLNGNNNPSLVTAYPNPTTSYVVVRVNDVNLFNSNARLFNQNGQLLQNIRLQQNNTTVDLSQFANGIYLLKLQNGEVLKLVKQ
jgi:hypothetical protein